MLESFTQVLYSYKNIKITIIRLYIYCNYKSKTEKEEKKKMKLHCYIGVNLPSIPGMIWVEYGRLRRVIKMIMENGNTNTFYNVILGAITIQGAQYYVDRYKYFSACIGTPLSLRKG